MCCPSRMPHGRILASAMTRLVASGEHEGQAQAHAAQPAAEFGELVVVMAAGPKRDRHRTPGVQLGRFFPMSGSFSRKEGRHGKAEWVFMGDRARRPFQSVREVGAERGVDEAHINLETCRQRIVLWAREGADGAHGDELLGEEV